MPIFRLVDEFVDPAAERSVLAAVARDPSVYWRVLDIIPPGAFVVEHAAWEAVAASIEEESPLVAPSDWEPAPDPYVAARRLADLLRRRLVAEAQERIEAALFDTNQPATRVIDLMDEEAARVQEAAGDDQSGDLLWARSRRERRVAGRR